MDLEALISEFAGSGVGDGLYREILRTVSAVVFGYGYPATYSQSGRWDEDAITALAHDWTTEKLLKRGQLEHLLIANETLRGFRKGLELSFRQFLISQKKRTTLDNLFQRAGAILESDSRFRLLQDIGRKATRLWGLATWSDHDAFQGSDTALIAAGFRLPEMRVIRYRSDARKLSPVISDRDLAAFMLSLFQELDAALRLEQIVLVLKYRFDLLDVIELSLETPVASDQEGHALPLIETISNGALLEDEALASETAATVLRELTPRQRFILREYVRPNATLTSVAERAGCSKSTVDNELHRAMAAIRRHADNSEEAEAVYEHVIEALNPPEEVGNGGT